MSGEAKQPDGTLWPWKTMLAQAASSVSGSSRLERSRQEHIRDIVREIIELPFVNNQPALEFFKTICIGTLLSHGHLHGQQLNVLAATEIDPAALNFSAGAASFSQNINGRTFQRAPMASLAGHQYAAYYDANRHVCLARRKLPAGAWQVIRFTDYTINGSDAHNVISLGICAGDGTIHLAFDHHKHPLRYRVSNPGVATSPESVSWSASQFGPVTGALGAVGTLTDVTYPSFFNAPNGNLMFYYRFGGSGSGDGMIHEYDGTTSSWTTGMGKFIARTGSYTGAFSTNSTTRNPYINGISYAGNRLHASWGWRETSNVISNHDLNYAYSDDHGRTWHNSTGALIGTTASSFITVNSPGVTVAPIAQNHDLGNQFTHHAYPDGSCHAIVSHFESGTSTRRYHHYWRDAAGTWSSEVLPFIGARPKLVGDDNRELFLAYASGGTLRIAKGVPDASQSSWTWTTIHSQTGRSEGGEGHIDTARWESESILSVYGQVAPNSAGDPSALSIFDYQVSAKAILPVPLNNQNDVALAPTLQWTPGIGAVDHRVFFGTDPGAVANATTTSPEYLGQQSSASFTPGAPLVESTTHYWRIDEVDEHSTVHPGRVWKFTTSGEQPPTTILTIYSDPKDASVREIPDVVDVSNPTTLIGAGGSNPWIDRCSVYVFQLPDLGPVVTPFATANLTFHYSNKQGALRDNDLYGLGRRGTPDVRSSDYYGQTATPDPTDATLLQLGILTESIPMGLINNSASGKHALRDYLNGQYESGAGAGQYIFLRLNSAGPKDGIRRATLAMSEGGVAEPLDTRPRLTLTTLSPFFNQEQWRIIHFGTTENVGTAADSFDANSDGEINLLEFATGQDPFANTLAETSVTRNGANLEFRYTRSKAALADGIRFRVEWSDSLAENSWSTDGVTEIADPENPGNNELEHRIAIVPPGTSGGRFVRLKSSIPP